MPYKDPEKQKAAQHRHYARNKDLYIRRGVNWKAKHDYRNTRKTYDDLPGLAPTLKEQRIQEGYLTSRMLAKELGIPPRQIRRACRVFEIKALKIGQEYYIPKYEAEQYAVWRRYYDIVLKHRPRSLRSMTCYFHINDICINQDLVLPDLKEFF